MIEINLLPEEMRPRKMALNLDIEMGKVKIIAGSALAGVLILLLLISSVGSCVRKKQIRRLKAKEENLRPEKSQIDTVNKEISVLKLKMDAVSGITGRRFLWSKKLGELSDLVLPGIWFTRIQTDLEGRLVIEGRAISKKEEAMAIVGKFMDNIKEDKAFFKDFASIKLESVQRRSVNERDVVDFRIVLYFREDGRT